MHIYMHTNIHKYIIISNQIIYFVTKPNNHFTITQLQNTQTVGDGHKERP